MAEKIKLVQGDTRPYIKVTLRDADGTAIDVSDATVNFKFRQSGSDITLFTVICLQPDGGTDGKIIFNFPEGGLNVDSGNYEGEIEIVFAPDDIQTVYEHLKFYVREQFN